MKYGKNEVAWKECLASHKLLDLMLLVCAEVWGGLSTLRRAKSYKYEYKIRILSVFICLKGQIHMASSEYWLCFIHFIYVEVFSHTALGCETAIMMNIEQYRTGRRRQKMNGIG